MIRFDFYLDKDQTKDYVVFEIYSSNEILKLKTKIIANGDYFNKLIDKKEKDENFLNLTDISFDADIDEIISRIESNFILINDFLKHWFIKKLTTSFNNYRRHLRDGISAC